MIVGPPERGSVLRYAYLWADEHRRGLEEARKERPTLVVALVVRSDDARSRLLVLPITHLPPAGPDDAVPLPLAVKRRLVIDEQPSWIVTTEANAFDWPGPDVRPVPGRLPLTPIYGRIPESLLARVAVSFLANRERRRGRLVPRST